MRKTFNWMVFFGIILFVGGVAIVWMIIWRNIPTSFDIVGATGKNDISLPIIAPENPIWRTDILDLILPAPAIVMSDRSNADVNSSEGSDIPNTIPTATTSVVSDVSNTNVNSSASSGIQNATPAASPNVMLDNINTSAIANESSDVQGASPAAFSNINSDERNTFANTPQPKRFGLIPDRLVIPVINLDAPIIPVSYKKLKWGSQVYYQWLTPEQYAVGWQESSNFLGQPGNTVLNGHHNAYGKVFKDLVTVKIGDAISIYSGSQEFRYKVVANMLLPERFESLSTRMENARWIEPSSDERITLITCWPADSNTHRVVVIAHPFENQENILVP